MYRSKIYNPRKRRYVFFSNTYDNPFLPKSYIEGLKESLDPKMAQRMIEGLWVRIRGETVYYQYSTRNFKKDEDYTLKPFQPIVITFDFNIGEGKPMSCALIQNEEKNGLKYVHVFDECVVEGADTESMMDELAGRGLLDHNCKYIINGDATGGARSTKSKSSDYDIIRKFLANYRGKHGRLDFSIEVPKSNPPIRKRHNLVNAYCKNAQGRSRLFVYKKCKITNKGLQSTTLKSGGQYIEDDSKSYQHITTAIGYHICWLDKQNRKDESFRMVNYQ